MDDTAHRPSRRRSLHSPETSKSPTVLRRISPRNPSRSSMSLGRCSRVFASSSFSHVVLPPVRGWAAVVRGRVGQTPAESRFPTHPEKASKRTGAGLCSFCLLSSPHPRLFVATHQPQSVNRQPPMLNRQRRRSVASPDTTNTGGSFLSLLPEGHPLYSGAWLALGQSGQSGIRTEGGGVGSVKDHMGLRVLPPPGAGLVEGSDPRHRMLETRPVVRRRVGGRSREMGPRPRTPSKPHDRTHCSTTSRHSSSPS